MDNPLKEGQVLNNIDTDEHTIEQSFIVTQPLEAVSPPLHHQEEKKSMKSENTDKYAP